MRGEADFANRLRWWRNRRGWSQLELAGRADISQRHLSFLEIGRASPSRDMVARLAATLDLPLCQQNELLVAAGFAPAWHETEFAAPELARMRDALVGPDVFRPYLANWAEIARYFIRSVEADAAADGTAETAALLERLLAHEGVRPLLKAVVVVGATEPVLPMHFRKGEVSLELFTTIATLGTPQDVTLQELRIESFFPMNDDTAAILRAWASRTS